MDDCTSDRYLNSPAVQTYITTQVVTSDQVRAVTASDLEQQRRKVEEEVDLLTAETLSSFRRSKYAAVTIPSSVKYSVNAGQPGNMARPRSPQKKNDVDHEQLQFLLDQQLSVIRQQLVSAHAPLSSLLSMQGSWLATPFAGLPSVESAEKQHAVLSYHLFAAALHPEHTMPSILCLVCVEQRESSNKVYIVCMARW